MKDGGDLRKFSMEDPETIEKRERAVKEAKEMAQKLQAENKGKDKEIADLKQ